MTPRTLIHRSLRFHWRSHLGVALGAALGSAALIGALVVGDSVRGTLRERALDRLAGASFALASSDRYFRDDLPNRMEENGPNSTVILQLPANASRQDGAARANRIQLLGVPEELLGLHLPPDTAVAAESVWLNRALMRQLNAQSGDELLLRIQKPSALSHDVAISTRNDSAVALRVRVAGVAPEAIANLNLQSTAGEPLNAFIRRSALAAAVNLDGRANLRLIGGQPAPAEKTGAVLEKLLEKVWTLDDLQAQIVPVENASTNPVTAAQMLELRTSRVFLDPSLADAAFAANTNARPILTLLANLIRAGTNATPYSMVTAAGAPWTPPEMRDDEILLSQWLANDLRVTVGDEISLTYFDPESGAQLLERTNVFRVRGVVPNEMPWADRTLMPDFPGIQKAESTHDWDAGFPLVHKIRDKDEEYWKRFRGTPKAFVTLAAGQKMWGNRFGNVTAIRFAMRTDTPPTPPKEGNSSSGDLEKQILANLKPEQLGFRFEPVREQALNATEHSQDFGGLFLGFSFFLIIAALLLMAMLFRFGIEQRMEEIGTLLALGFTPKQVRRLLLGEGTLLALAGAALGTAGGLAYARAMLHGLTTIWSEAVGNSILNFHATPETLLAGLLASVVVSAFVIWLTMRKFVRRPARELLAGEIQSPRPKVRNRGAWIGAMSLAAALGLIGWALAKGDTANAEIFFSAGSLVLIGGLSLLSAWLGRKNAGAASARNISDSDIRTACPTLGSLALRGGARRRNRSLSTAGMLACGSFLIVSIGVFRLDANRDATARSSGTGGFALIGETTMPVTQDLNSQAGRDFFALNESDLKGVTFVPFRVRAGDEASCLNLNGAQQPRLLGVKSETLDGRFTLAKGDGWSALKTEIQDALVIPAIGDANSIQWAMHKKVGDTIDYVDERGRPFKVRIVGAVANSILQGSLIIDETQFVKRYPGESGHRMFLIDAPSNTVAQVSAELSRAMQDVGLELVPAPQRLAQFNAVQNTYLGTFQILGGLGLLLGSAGLGIVVLRNVLERRGELALLMAVGFRKKLLRRMLVMEHGALLASGLAIGIAAAIVAVLPSALSPGGELPYATLAVTLAAVVVNGMLWTWLATAAAIRGNLLAALRNE